MRTPEQESETSRGVDVVIDIACDRYGTRIVPMLAGVHHAVYDVDRLARAGELRSLVGASLIVLGAHTSSGETSDALAARIRSLLPVASIFVCTRRAERGHLRICEYARAGVDDLFFVETEAELMAFLDEVRARLAAPPPTNVLCELSAANLSRGRDIALWCVRNSYRKRTVKSVVTWFDIDPKTANRQCAEGGFVHTSALLRSGRLYHLQEIRRRTHVSGAEIARRLGFGDAKALDVFRARARRSGLPATLLPTRSARVVNRGR
jgi:hypothetical protein